MNNSQVLNNTLNTLIDSVATASQQPCTLNHSAVFNQSTDINGKEIIMFHYIYYVKCMYELEESKFDTEPIN